MSISDVQAVVSRPAVAPDRDRPLALALAIRLLRTLAFVGLSAIATLGLWLAFLKLFHLNPYFAKSPQDVWRYVTSDAQAAANRAELRRQLAITGRDAALGYVFGTVAALVIAIGFVTSRTVEQTFLPIAVALRSVPLVAMTPLLTLVFGRDLLGVTVIAGIVTFFPSLVNLVQGLRSAPPDAVLLMRAYDAGRFTTLRKIQLPSAVPALFSSAKIAAPGALLGAVLAEFLATGHGLGALMLSSSSSSRFATLWASVVLVTLAAVAVYALVSLIEGPALRRFAPSQIAR